MRDLALIGSREVARLLRPLGLTLASFARLDIAPRPVVRMGQDGRILRWDRSAVEFFVGERLEEAHREIARQAARAVVG